MNTNFYFKFQNYPLMLKLRHACRIKLYEIMQLRNYAILLF